MVNITAAFFALLDHAYPSTGFGLGPPVSFSFKYPLWILGWIHQINLVLMPRWIVCRAHKINLIIKARLGEYCFKYSLDQLRLLSIGMGKWGGGGEERRRLSARHTHRC